MSLDDGESLKDRLAGLLDILELLTTQVRTYERALPPDNFQARAAVATLGELGQQALNELQDLLNSFDPPVTTHPLSSREFEVLSLVASGLTNKEIAYRLGLSERTIQFHLKSIFNKTGTYSRTEATALALRQGWFNNDGN